jgi:pilus assembly protein CpaB
MSLRVVIMGLMMVTAVALGLIGYQIANPPRTVTTAVTPQTIKPLTLTYLVAAHPVSPGTLARTDDFSPRTVAADKLPEGAILATDEARVGLRGALVRTYLDAGAPLLTTDLMRPRDRGFLAAVLSPGTRAVSIGVDPVTGVAGLIWPGDHVDIILTQELTQPGQRPQISSQAVLSNVRVIAVDQDMSQGAPTTGNATGRLASTVTLQATTDQAEKLAVAGRLGRLSLAIRAASDDAKVDSASSVSSADVSAMPVPMATPVGTRMQLIQGDQRSEVNFR